jgi:hypothetical protein
VQAVGTKAEDHIPNLDSTAIDHFRSINHTDNAARQVVLALAIHAGHLRCLTANQRAARSAACLGEPGEQLIENARLQLFGANVIEKEKWTRPQDRYVVDAMINEVRTDGVMPVHGESDLQFRADAIYARDQHRIAHSREVWREQSAEPADLAQDLRTVRAFDARLDAPLDQVAEIDVDSGERVSLFLLLPFCHVERSRDTSSCLLMHRILMELEIPRLRSE